jgi:hypothetical protein
LLIKPQIHQLPTLLGAIHKQRLQEEEDRCMRVKKKAKINLVKPYKK